MPFFHLENLRFFRVLRTRDRLVRSGRYFILSLLVSGVAASDAPGCRRRSDHSLGFAGVVGGRKFGAPLTFTFRR